MILGESSGQEGSTMADLGRDVDSKFDANVPTVLGETYDQQAASFCGEAFVARYIRVWAIYVPLCFTSPNYKGDIMTLTDMCFGDVKQIPKSWDINPNPCYRYTENQWIGRKILTGNQWDFPVKIWGFPVDFPLNHPSLRRTGLLG